MSTSPKDKESRKESEKKIETPDLGPYDVCSCDKVAGDNPYCFIHSKN